MSAYTMDQVWAPITAHYREILAQHTWGHLAPKKNLLYHGKIIFAVGIFGSDNLNPTAIECDFKSRRGIELSSSPWFYDSMSEMLSSFASERWDDVNVRFTKPIVEAGNVYEWVGTFRNYLFEGTVRRLKLI